jgi:hypothetical protein
VSKTIEIRGPGEPWRVQVAPGTRVVTAPGKLRADGYEEVCYGFTGKHTADGVEIWDAAHAVQVGRMLSDALGQLGLDALRETNLKN